MHCLYKQQAVADCQNVAIHMESHENLAGETLIEPHHLPQHPQQLNLGQQQQQQQ